MKPAVITDLWSCRDADIIPLPHFGAVWSAAGQELQTPVQTSNLKEELFSFLRLCFTKKTTYLKSIRVITLQIKWQFNYFKKVSQNDLVFSPLKLCWENRPNCLVLWELLSLNELFIFILMKLLLVCNHKKIWFVYKFQAL